MFPNAYILLSAMVCVSYFKRWYLGSGNHMTLLLSTVSGNWTWPETWPLGILERSGKMSASLKTQLLSKSNFCKDPSKQIHHEVLFISGLHEHAQPSWFGHLVAALIWSQKTMNSLTLQNTCFSYLANGKESLLHKVTSRVKGDNVCYCGTQ